MYDCLLKKAQEAGFSRYEISNFSRPGKECLHNIAYWRGKEYYGRWLFRLQPLKGVRYTHSPSLAFYCQSMEAEDSFKKNLKWNDWQEDVLSPLARAGEIAAIGLRMTRGWRFEEFYERTAIAYKTTGLKQCKSFVLEVRVNFSKEVFVLPQEVYVLQTSQQKNLYY
jgi:oxygen-independent coproporphyrinogen-3 oxidase